MPSAFVSRPAGRPIGLALGLAAILVILAGSAAVAPVAADEPGDAARVSPQSGAGVLPAADRPPATGTLGWALRALGPFYGAVFFGLGLLLAALLALNLLAVRRENVVPGTLVERLQDLLGSRQYQEAYEAAKADASFLAHLLSAAMARLSFGYDRAVEAMHEAAEDENIKMEHRLSYLALVGTVAPMVGLLGTVQGMIASFMVIAGRDQTPKPWELAAGISTALFTTLVGLAIAIPAIAAYNILRNRTARLVLEAGILGEGLMLPLSKAGRGAGA
jgi:biopolymer transport protein ExbB